MVYSHIPRIKAIYNRLLGKDIIVYKKVTVCNKKERTRYSGVLTMVIPAKAKCRLHSSTLGEERNKCRAQYALPITLELVNGNKIESFQDIEIESYIQGYFYYKIGEIAKPSYFDTSRNICSGGIHFFLDKEWARNY